MGYDTGDETSAFEGKIEHQTAKAYLIEPTLGGDAIWLPKSQCFSMTEPDGDGNREFTVARWWAKKNGIT